MNRLPWVISTSPAPPGGGGALGWLHQLASAVLGAPAPRQRAWGRPPSAPWASGTTGAAEAGPTARTTAAEAAPTAAHHRERITSRPPAGRVLGSALDGGAGAGVAVVEEGAAAGRLLGLLDPAGGPAERVQRPQEALVRDVLPRHRAVAAPPGAAQGVQAAVVARPGRRRRTPRPPRGPRRRRRARPRPGSRPGGRPPPAAGLDPPASSAATAASGPSGRRVGGVSAEQVVVAHGASLADAGDAAGARPGGRARFVRVSLPGGGAPTRARDLDHARDHDDQRGGRPGRDDPRPVPRGDRPGVRAGPAPDGARPVPAGLHGLHRRGVRGRPSAEATRRVGGVALLRGADEHAAFVLEVCGVLPGFRVDERARVRRRARPEAQDLPD